MKTIPLQGAAEELIMRTMYFRRATKKKGGIDYDSWLLVESVRTARGPRQRVVATIGKLPGLDREERISWEEISRILSGKPRPAPDLFAQPEEPPSWATVNINGVSVERLRSFGDVYLGLLLWNKLGLADFCRDHVLSSREDVPWSIMAAILVLARFCAPSSELQIAEFWYGKTALDDMGLLTTRSTTTGFIVLWMHCFPTRMPCAWPYLYHSLMFFGKPFPNHKEKQYALLCHQMFLDT